jgi:rubrerythrin
MKRHFTSLNTQEALRVAIFVEERNARIYRQFAELFGGFPDVDSREIAAVFAEMAAEEVSHGAQLENRYRQHFGQAPCEITAEEVEDLVELPHFPDGNIFAISRAGVSAAPRMQGLAIALAAEEGAVRFYERLAEIAEEPEFGEFYADLARFEAEHVAELRRKMKLAQDAVLGESA